MTSNNCNLKVLQFNPEPSAIFTREVLDELQIKAILIGRLAVWAWLPDPGKHGYTKDFDLAIHKKDRTRIAQYLNQKNYKLYDLSIGGINVSVPEKNINVDFIDRCSLLEGDLSPLFENAIKHADQQVKIEDRLEFKIANLEHLIAMKIATMEQKDEDDAKNLLRIDTIKIDQLRELIERFLGIGARIKLERLLRDDAHPRAIPRRQYYLTKGGLNG